MNTPLYYLDRKTGEKKEELVYGKRALEYLYSHSFSAKILNALVSKSALISFLYGLLQKTPFSKKKILPFIEKFRIDASEFLLSPSQFSSFNDFFIRKLKAECRPIASAALVMPADGRYLFFPKFSQNDSIHVKGKKFDLKALLQDEMLANKYSMGSLVVARLCPTDYHRFHFPLDCTPSCSKKINGPLFSVNPIALKRNINILSENKRVITPLVSSEFGTVLAIEVGATNVGSIHQTFEPERFYSKGDEKGYFSFGGSCLLLLFERETVEFETDLLNHPLEIFCKMGQPLGRFMQKKTN